MIFKKPMKGYNKGMENSYSLEMDILLWSLLPFMVTYLPPGFFGG